MVIAIYPRKSVYRDNSDSVQVQIQMCKEYAGIIYRDKSPEFRIYDKDEGFSGKNTNRPSFQALMADVKCGTIDVVMVYRLDRISRNVSEFSVMYDIFQRHNVSFVSVKESFDTTTPIGRTVMYILSAFSQLERENTSERVADNMRALGESGKWTGGKVPTGMVSVRRKLGEKEHSYLMVEENTIGLVKLIYGLILDGYPITRVERYCRDNGIRSRTGKFLNTSQIYTILTNPVYCQNSMEAYYYFSEKGCTLQDPVFFDGTKGLIAYGRTKTITGSSSQHMQPVEKWSVASGIHEPVITAADWIAAQNRLGTNKMIRTAKHQCGILKGVIRCKCGARMEVRTYLKNNIRFSYYYCTDMARQGRKKCNTAYIRIEEVEEAFLHQLRKIRFDPQGFQLRDDCTGLVDSKSLKAELKYLQESINNLTNALTQAMDTPAATYIIRQITELDAQKKNVTQALQKTERQAAAAKSLDEAAAEIYNQICYLLDNFEEINYTGKNELIRKIISSCILDTETKSLRIIF